MGVSYVIPVPFFWLISVFFSIYTSLLPSKITRRIYRFSPNYSPLLFLPLIVGCGKLISCSFLPEICWIFGGGIPQEGRGVFVRVEVGVFKVYVV